MIKPASFINLCICISSLKFLLLKTYVSTDFDVHWNWMSITYNLPIADWYLDETSEWTLDYPPLFAAFEFLLAIFAQISNLGDELTLTKDRIRSESMIIYQKSTVIASDFVYYYAVYLLCCSLEPYVSHADAIKKKAKDEKDGKLETAPTFNVTQGLFDALYRPDTTSCIALLLLFQPGLILVDHIHFQYNGLLSGILLLSVANIVEKKYATGSFWFAILLNLKHIYLYCAPAFGIYLLTGYCAAKAVDRNRVSSFILRCGKLGLVVLLVFVVVFAPFVDLRILTQIFSRLFPFKRGLTHAYWAPNVWSLYNTADKVLATVFRDTLYTKFDMESISKAKLISSTSGLVQEYKHLYLPSIEPLTTFILVGVFTVPLVIRFFFGIGRRRPLLFMKAVTLAAFTSFMFGWHVHEKAILLILLPLIPISFIDQNLKKVFLRLTLAGTYSLFPLLFQPAEYLTKLSLLVAYYFYARSLTSIISHGDGRKSNLEAKGLLRTWSRRLYNLLDDAFVLGLVIIEIYSTFIHGRYSYDWNPIAVLNKYEFLPLMLTSSFSALGITFSYLELYYDFALGADELLAAAAAAAT